MPFAMVFAGSSLILSAFGLVAAGFTFFVGVPVLFFNQLFKFENP